MYNIVDPTTALTKKDKIKKKIVKYLEKVIYW